MGVGGEEAVPHSIPWQVSLRRKSDDFHFCGGSVLSSNAIVTAAHCTEIWDSPGEVQIIAGGHNNAQPDGLEQRRDVAKPTVHEDYASLKNDIAIWELTEPLLLDERVQPVPMPTSMQESTGSCNVSGWGTLHSGGQTPDQLMVVSVPIVAEARCQLEYPFQIAKSMICAGEYGKDSCQDTSEDFTTLESTLRSPTSSTGLRLTPLLFLPPPCLRLPLCHLRPLQCLPPLCLTLPPMCQRRLPLKNGLPLKNQGLPLKNGPPPMNGLPLLCLPLKNGLLPQNRLPLKNGLLPLCHRRQP